MEAPDDAAWQALAEGAFERAEHLANDLLARWNGEEHVEGWLPDDIRHRAHVVLGHVHLRRGDLNGAEAELMRAADVDWTPVLASFGPDTSLAWSLLIEGRTSAPQAFAQRFSRFWRVRSRADHFERAARGDG